MQINCAQVSCTHARTHPARRRGHPGARPPAALRLLSALRLHGAATATELAERLDTNTGATSYHLRKLESVGLVTDTGDGEGKRRLWQAASRSHGWRTSDFADDEDAATSLNWLTRDYVRTAADHCRSGTTWSTHWSADWQDALGVSDDAMLITATQARALQDELAAVLARYSEAGSDDPDARRISVWS